MTHTAKLTAADGAAHDWFGHSVAISGDTVVAGAHQADVGSNLEQGAAYVFDFFPNLSLRKTVDDEVPVPGQRITYTIVISSRSVLTATGAVVSDTLPTGLNFVGPVTLDPAGAGTPGTAPPLLASGLTITVGQSITLTFPVTVSTNLAVGTHLLTNTAEATSTEMSIPARDSQVVTVTVASGSSDSNVYLPVILKN
jgi:uncharacterized repeat protein (TIGR01451 family)